MSADKGGPRDWDKELADIDKLIAAGPAPAQAQVPTAPGKRQTAAPQPAGGGRPASGRRETWTTWLLFVLAALLGAGLTFLWPYRQDCGMPLYGYLGSIAAFGVASLWSMVWSWRTRAAAVHFLSIGLLFWSAGLAAREVLPRIGYAKTAATWECRVSPPR